MGDLSQSLDVLEAAVTAGAVRALRKRADAQRQKAAFGITPGEYPHGGVLIIASGARRALDIAHDLSAIADDLEAGTPS